MSWTDEARAAAAEAKKRMTAAEKESDKHVAALDALRRKHKIPVGTSIQTHPEGVKISANWSAANEKYRSAGADYATAMARLGKPLKRF